MGALSGQIGGSFHVHEEEAGAQTVKEIQEEVACMKFIHIPLSFCKYLYIFMVYLNTLYLNVL